MSVQSFVIKTPTQIGYVFEMPLDGTGYIVLPPNVTTLPVDEWCGKFLRACGDEFEKREIATPIPKRAYPIAEFIKVSESIEFLPIELYRVIKNRYPADYIVHVIQNTHMAFVLENKEDKFEIPLVYCENAITEYVVYGMNCSSMSVFNRAQSIVMTPKISNNNIPVTVNKRLLIELTNTSLSKWSCVGNPGQHIHAIIDPQPVVLTLSWVCVDCEKKQINPACFEKVDGTMICYACTSQGHEAKYIFFPQGK